MSKYLERSRTEITEALEEYALENDKDQAWYDERVEVLDTWLDSGAPEWEYRGTEVAYYLRGDPHPFAAKREEKVFAALSSKISDWLGRQFSNDPERGRYTMLCEISDWRQEFHYTSYPVPALDVILQFLARCLAQVEQEKEYCNEQYLLFRSYRDTEWSNKAEDILHQFIVDERLESRHNRNSPSVRDIRDKAVQELIENHDFEGAFAWRMAFYQRQQDVITELKAIITSEE